MSNRSGDHERTRLRARDLEAEFGARAAEMKTLDATFRAVGSKVIRFFLLSAAVFWCCVMIYLSDSHKIRAGVRKPVHLFAALQPAAFHV